MPFPSPGDPANYTLGGSTFSFEGTDLGNVVSGVVTPDLEDLSIYNAGLGRPAPDIDNAVPLAATVGMTINLLLDELTSEAMKLFFQGNPSDLAVTIVPFSRGAIIGDGVLNGVSLSGQNYTWVIPKLQIKPAGSMEYTTNDWVSLPLDVILYPDLTQPSAPFGTMTLLGTP